MAGLQHSVMQAWACLPGTKVSAPGHACWPLLTARLTRIQLTQSRQLQALPGLADT